MLRNLIIISTFAVFLVFFSEVKAQPILKNGEITKDLVITLNSSSTVQFSTRYEYTIVSDGKVFYEQQSNLLPVKKLGGVMLYDIKTGRKINNSEPKKPRVKEKLSKKQVKQIISEFEKSGFYEMNEYYNGDITLVGGACVNHAETIGLSISANGKTKNVAFFLGCSYGENSPLKKFSILYTKISEQLSGVKKEIGKPLIHN